MDQQVKEEVSAEQHCRIGRFVLIHFRRIKRPSGPTCGVFIDSILYTSAIRLTPDIVEHPSSSYHLPLYLIKADSLKPKRSLVFAKTMRLLS